MVLAYENVATQNNSGTLALTVGGLDPTFLTAPALTNQPSIVTNNWKANSLQISNISANAATPIRIQAVGPGMPGTNPLNLTIGTLLGLDPGQTAQGNASPQWMQLVLQNTNGYLSIFVLIGGPPDNTGNNAYVMSVNAAQNSGPGTGINPPAGYYATTTSNSFTYQFNWGSSLVFVANMSGATSFGSTVLLRPL
jgi:hypothetical protein